MNTILWPYKEEYAYYLEAIKKYRNEFDITSVVIPRSFSRFCKVPDGIEIYHNLEDAFPSVECIWILPNESISLVYETAMKAIKKRKSVIVCSFLPNNIKVELERIAEQNNVRFYYPKSTTSWEYLRRRADVYTHQDSIVVAVSAMTQGIDTSEVVIRLADELEEKGYSVVIVSTSPELCMLQTEPLIFDEVIDENLDETVIQINRLLNYCEYKNRTKITILQLPNEGIIRVTSDYNTCFGVRTYLISQAVDIDYCVMVTPMIGLDDETISDLSENSMVRYGFGFDCIFFINKTIDMLGIPGEMSLRYNLVEQQKVLDLIVKLKKTERNIIYLSHSSNSYEIITNDIINKLSN